MNVTHESVQHPQFGSGTVVSQSDGTVTVEFGEAVGTKKFVYPAAFQSFLALCDTGTKAKMDDELHELKAQAEEVSRKLEEEERLRLEKVKSASAAQKRTTKKRPAVKKTPKKAKPEEDLSEDQEDWA